MAHLELDDGLGVAYEIHGRDGPWLTVLHGGLVGSVSWRRAGARLSRFCRVLTYDLRGYGGSDRGERPFTFADLARDVLGLWDALGIRRSCLLGFSAGGCVAQLLTAAAPERVEGLVLESTTALLDRDGAAGFAQRADAVERQGTPGDADEHVRRAFSDGFRVEQPELVAEYAAEVARADARTLAWTFRALADHDGREAVASAGCPILVLRGAQDAGMHSGYAREIAGLAPHARAAVLPRAGHTLHLEAPSTFAHLVADFVTSGGAVLAGDRSVVGG